MLANQLFEVKHPLTKHLLFCAPSPPPAPDYAGAAKAQGAANVDAARAQGRINNPNVDNPYGTQTVTWNGDTPTVTQRFSGAQQQLYDLGNMAKVNMNNLAIQGTDIAKDVLGNRLNLDSLPDRPGSSTDTRTKVMDAMMARVNEDTDRQKGVTHSNLIASGIPPGSKAYQDAMALTERGRTDARNQAFLASGQEMSRDFQTDSQRRRDALAETLTERQTPLNEITALMSGSQVSNPFSMPGYAQNAQVAPAPIFGATQAAGDWNADLYNAKAAQAGNLQQGLFGLGSSGLMAGAMLSDKRLKSNIVKLGEHPLGIGWYEYDIEGRHEQGVMAQELAEVMPEAVVTMPNGYLGVRYDLIGGRHVVIAR